MKKVWKWVIGIVVVLVIVAALVMGAFMLRSHFGNVVRVENLNRPGVQVPGNGDGQRGGPGRFPGMMPFGNDGWGGRGMHVRGPGMMGYGRMMPFGGLIGGLFLLGLLALFVLGIVWLVRRLRKPTAALAPVAAAHPCPKCGKSVQEDWKNCPYCGKKL